jgi:hypothetical protein
MRVLVGWELAGAARTGFDQLDLGRATIGDAVWGPHQLLRDLELRLGRSFDAEPEALRVARWAARLATLAPLGRFYSKSFDVDAQGTAAALLGLRDLLIEAGWAGQSIAGGGARLDALAELEQLSHPALPLGACDRLAAVASALAGRLPRLYAELVLIEPLALWSTCWQRIFCALQQAGTQLSMHAVRFRGAHVASDLGRVQAALMNNGTGDVGRLEGDGSFLLLNAETAWEAARATAAILATLAPERAVVIRGGDVSALDNALSVQGLATQGWRSNSAWRAALQVLPLALELAFEPKDPYRILELLTLSVGPFQGFAGRRLAKALSRSPGVGSPAWQEAKVELARGADAYALDRLASAPASGEEQSARLLRRIADWFEQAGADPVVGATKPELLAVIERVRGWIISRLPGSPDDALLLAAARHTGALRSALESDPRLLLSLVEVRRLAESVLLSGTTAELVLERAGRLDYVDAPGNLGVARDVVLWWHFVAGGAAAQALPWRKHELAALSAAGIHFPDPRARLEEQAKGWRRAVLAASQRVILVVPQNGLGMSLTPHPLWDEIVARCGADGPALARVILHARQLLSQSSLALLLPRPPLDELTAAVLPGGHQEWRVPAEYLRPMDHFSSSSLNALLGCPLQWALQYRAGVNAGGHALPALFMLSGTLGHRLVEVLHGQGAFELPDSALQGTAEAALDLLFVREGSVLLRAGMAFERSQLRQQLVHSVLVLARALRAAELRIVAVEKAIEVSWRGVKLVGSIDLLVEASDGTQAIIDMKWGIADYRGLLASGQALQLATYAFATAQEQATQTLTEAGYFSLKQSKLFGLPGTLLPNAEEIAGPTLEQTWQKVEAAVDKAERWVASGRFPVTGLARSVSLLTAIGVPESEQARHFALGRGASCKYCNFEVLCGRRWEGQL